MEMFFFHHIKRTNGTIDKTIDVEETLDKAKKDFRKFLGDYGYGAKAEVDFASAMITDFNGEVVWPYCELWAGPGVENVKYFMHRIRHDKSQSGQAAWATGIEVKDTIDAAKQALNAYLGAYGYEQTEETMNYDFVDCRISDMVGADLAHDMWKEPQPEPNA